MVLAVWSTLLPVLCFPINRKCLHWDNRPFSFFYSTGSVDAELRVAGTHRPLRSGQATNQFQASAPLSGFLVSVSALPSVEGCKRGDAGMFTIGNKQPQRTPQQKSKESQCWLGNDMHAGRIVHSGQIVVRP